MNKVKERILARKHVYDWCGTCKRFNCSASRVINQPHKLEFHDTNRITIITNTGDYSSVIMTEEFKNFCPGYKRE